MTRESGVGNRESDAHRTTGVDVHDSLPPTPDSRFRRTLVSVLAIQTVTLLLLWLLQARYAR